MVAYLFDKREPGMLVVVVPWQGEMFVESPTRGLEYVTAVGIDTEVSRWFRFTDVLGFRA